MSPSTAETVPDMLGMTLAGARSALDAADIGKYSWLYGCYGSSNINEVVKQVPGGGAEIARTVVVEIFLQANNCTETVPDVIGMTLAGARSALDAADIGKYSWLYGCYGSSNFNEVVKQTPGGAAKVPRTTDVEIFLQADNCPTTVPNVVGLNESAAISMLEQAGFRVHWIFECLGSPAIGLVVTQSPAAGTSDDRGNTVSIQLQANNC
jgi:eukaryotic-like serine/threonine-protein kinase